MLSLFNSFFQIKMESCAGHSANENLIVKVWYLTDTSWEVKPLCIGSLSTVSQLRQLFQREGIKVCPIRTSQYDWENFIWVHNGVIMDDMAIVSGNTKFSFTYIYQRFIQNFHS